MGVCHPHGTLAPLRFHLPRAPALVCLSLPGSGVASPFDGVTEPDVQAAGAGIGVSPCIMIWLCREKLQWECRRGPRPLAGHKDPPPTRPVTSARKFCVFQRAWQAGQMVTGTFPETGWFHLAASPKRARRRAGREVKWTTTASLLALGTSILIATLVPLLAADRSGLGRFTSGGVGVTHAHNASLDAEKHVTRTATFALG